jgi:hypothetical protein
MTEQIELQKLVDELESPLNEMSQGIKLLWKLSETFDDANDQDALAFVANSLGNTVDRLEKAHSALHRALRQDGAPTPLHSV